ncbi:DUF6797 domain-containing protein [Rubripirellula reticaptiva]|uniref:Auracyanin-A n=1 Tax=Rubripirellula reticaptiva TaxID=2528013 RepID=A0A5C6EWN7_9BACT|nr:DUF6797 domain-containing protein [Rubripirellula reticaptiva]TWU51651.1 Auracyanin-A precursor [Rubripirellula reticaptiva]
MNKTKATVFPIFLSVLLSVLDIGESWCAEPADLLRIDNQVAWCIVPFDATKRSPAERASMLKELRITRCAYDWRDEHVPTFEQEILEYKKQGIEFFAFWSVHEDAFKLFKKYEIHPQIWQTLAAPGEGSATEQVQAAAKSLLPLCRRTSEIDCKLGLYNHGGWGGEPKNLVAVCKRLHELGQTHVGIVYNFHHGHGHIDDWKESLDQMLPYLLCVNLNGMNRQAQPKILGIGKGEHELAMIRTLVASGYQGPIGILDHRPELDARQSLLENRDGLDWVRKEIAKPGSGGPKPTGPQPSTNDSSRSSGRVFPGASAYRVPPITVEVRATIHSRDQYNLLVASDTKASSDHWEMFTMKGSGELTVYLPGSVPDHVRSTSMICDGKPHSLAMHYEAHRVRLYADGKQVADQTIESRNLETRVAGAFAIGRLVEGTFRCDGQIDWVRISKGIRELSAEAATIVDRDGATVGYWNLTAIGEAKPPKATEPAISQSSLTEMPYDAAIVERFAAQSLKHGDAERGARVFADSKTACLSCHRVGSLGGAVGPDLSVLAKDRTVNQIIESVLWPKREVKPEYTTWRILRSDGSILSGYKIADDEVGVTLRDTNTNVETRIASDDIEQLIAGDTVMPDGLAGAMRDEQQVDLFRFLSELGRDGQPLSESLQHAIRETQQQTAHSHQSAHFQVTREPLEPSRWPHCRADVNRDRQYDFYTKQAEHYRAATHFRALIAPYPGLDGGDQGHWGNQDEQTWADGRWNDAKLGSVQSGVFRAKGLTIPRGVCVQLGDDGELATCFNPDTLSYDAVWSGGFVKLNSVRHGFVDGLKPRGQLVKHEKSKAPDQSFQYHGFYRYGKRIVFAYRIGDAEYLDSPWVDDGKFVREVAPVDKHSLRAAISGGTSQWPDVLETDVVLGTETPYAIDTIELPTDNPWKIPLFCGDHDFLPDGSALVCTMQGDVWRVSGITFGSNQSGKAHWRRFASGLHQPLGLVVSDGKIFVQCRDQLTRLEDRNGDGEADFYECFSNAFVTSPAGHDFICGLQRDAAGNFYTASGNQGLLRISGDGTKAETIATGFRNPDGLGILPDGGVTVPVSEGQWTPASAINLVRPSSHSASESPSHFGYRGPIDGQPPELPLVYLPRGIDNSAGGQAYVASDTFGPLDGQLVHFSFGTGSWFVVLRDEVDGQSQGAVVPMTGDFLSGAHRGRFNPVDGQLYVSGMNGWGSYTPDDGCFQRVRYTGDSVQVPTGFHVHSNGVQVTFSAAIDPAIAEDPEQQFAQCWNYHYSTAYGSPELSTTHPGSPGHDHLSITSATVLPDGRSVFLEIPDLQPVNQLHLRMHVNEVDTLTCSPSGMGHDLFVTVHKMAQPFVDFPGYVAREKTIAVHPLLFDLAADNVKKVNPWQSEIASARKIEIVTGQNLAFATKQFRVKANEPISLRLSNPDVVPHNWVLVRPGTLKQVGELGNRLIADPTAVSRHYIPETDAVLVHTDIVDPGDEQTVNFIAPAAPGNYPFLCTFPGHWMVMNGTMIVE